MRIILNLIELKFVNIFNKENVNKVKTVTMHIIMMKYQILINK